MSIPPPTSLSIGAVERETGLSKDTLRVWERRYNFPVPQRDEFGERIYPPDQVEKLRLIKNLMDQGHRPGKIVGAEIDLLRGMAGRRKTGDPTAALAEPPREDLLHCIALCRTHQVDELRRVLSQSLLRMGLYRFVTEVVAPLNALIGKHWADGQLAVFEEHLYTECVQTVMRNAIATIPSGGITTESRPRPRILLTTLSQEQHGLGLLMAEAIFALEGAYCISLGVQTPVMDIVQAARVQAADIVALSFSASMRPAQVLEGLANLRAELLPDIEIWAGGSNAALHRRPPAAIKVLELREIGNALAQWRDRLPSAAA